MRQRFRIQTESINNINFTKENSMKKKPTSTAIALAAPSELDVAEGLQKQYVETLTAQDNAVRETLKFGMMLANAEGICTRTNTKTSPHDTRSGTGMKAWLAEHCPTIDYDKAMRWKRLAERVSATAELPQEANWTEVLQAPPESAESVAVNAALDDVIGGRSLRQLMFDFTPETPNMVKAREELYARFEKEPDDEMLCECVKRVESGELAPNRWEAAYIGMSHTAGQQRKATDYANLATRGIKMIESSLAQNHELIIDSAVGEVTKLLGKALAAMPEHILKKILRHVPTEIMGAKTK